MSSSKFLAERRVKIEALLKKVKETLAFLRRKFQRLFSQMYRLSYFEKLRLHLKYFVQVWMPNLIQDIAKLGKVQEVSNRCALVMKPLASRSGLIDSNSFHIVRGGHGMFS